MLNFLKKVRETFKENSFASAFFGTLLVGTTFALAAAAPIVFPPSISISLPVAFCIASAGLVSMSSLIGGVVMAVNAFARKNSSILKGVAGLLIGCTLSIYGVAKIIDTSSAFLSKSIPPATDIFNFESGKVKAEIAANLSMKVQAVKKLALRK